MLSRAPARCSDFSFKLRHFFLINFFRKKPLLFQDKDRRFFRCCLPGVHLIILPMLFFSCRICSAALRQMILMYLSQVSITSMLARMAAMFSSTASASAKAQSPENRAFPRPGSAIWRNIYQAVCRIRPDAGRAFGNEPDTLSFSMPSSAAGKAGATAAASSLLESLPLAASLRLFPACSALFVYPGKNVVVKMSWRPVENFQAETDADGGKRVKPPDVLSAHQASTAFSIGTASPCVQCSARSITLGLAPCVAASRWAGDAASALPASPAWR